MAETHEYTRVAADSTEAGGGGGGGGQSKLITLLKPWKLYRDLPNKLFPHQWPSFIDFFFLLISAETPNCQKLQVSWICG